MSHLCLSDTSPISEATLLACWTHDMEIKQVLKSKIMKVGRCLSVLGEFRHLQTQCFKIHISGQNKPDLYY